MNSNSPFIVLKIHLNFKIQHMWASLNVWKAAKSLVKNILKVLLKKQKRRRCHLVGYYNLYTPGYIDTAQLPSFYLY
jgi:hypothetical protein